MSRDIRIGFGIPATVIGAVQDAAQHAPARSQKPVEPEAVFGRLDLLGILRADGVHRVGENNAGLQEIDLAPELDSRPGV